MAAKKIFYHTFYYYHTIGAFPKSIPEEHKITV